jgi:hypothetical protein
MKKWWTWYNDEYVPYKRAQKSSELPVGVGGVVGVADLVDQLNEQASSNSGDPTGE